MARVIREPIRAELRFQSFLGTCKTPLGLGKSIKISAHFLDNFSGQEIVQADMMVGFRALVARREFGADFSGPRRFNCQRLRIQRKNRSLNATLNLFHPDFGISAISLPSKNLHSKIHRAITGRL